MRKFSNSDYEKTHFNVNIAGLEAEINTVYPSSYYFCEQYLSDGKPLFKIEITQEELRREVEQGGGAFFTYTGQAKDNNYVIERDNSESRMEIALVYRKFIEAALDHNIIFMHGAVIAVGNKAVMFTAPSGTGKTTHIMKWLENLAGAFVVNGDKPLIKIQDNEITAYGTPWCGKEKMATNTKVPLEAIVLMERNERNLIEEISFGQAYPFLIQQTYLPHDPEKAKKTLDRLYHLYGKVHIYRFRFDNYADDCFDVAYQGILGTKG